MHPTSSTILPPLSARGAKRSESADHFGRTPRLGRVAMVNLGRSNPAGWGLARGLLYLFDRRNKGRTRAWGRSVSTGFDRVQQDYCSRKGYFSPTRPFRLTDTSPTVRPVPWAIQPTAVLLALSGNRLIISTAIFTDATYADKLLPITLCTGFHAPDKVLHIASVFVAISKCTERFRMFYKRLPELPTLFHQPEFCGRIL